MSWANLDAGDQLESPPGSLHLATHQLKSHVSILAESQDLREVSWNLQDDEQKGRQFIVRSRKVKKEDRRSAWQLANKGKVGGEDDHLTPVTRQYLRPLITQPL